ncbi:hypothetical protein QEH52_03670 [Coraliomargarita sp. SDUM461003]|uniref:Porin domain-containing protein n=1 Tax=Thalassobacterium maritimum TaxID=3041265 RepID=A0ABU1AR11_9BACT|nr:hypothetical protein [Coraliomargarita sp. SDUM461003]MDQ8206592.1 hypothetical protein [Coraliomargarita sp. SDUM461003]
MKLQKQLIASLAGAAFLGSVANAEIPLTDDLSAYGYIDMALTDGDDSGDTETAVAEFELGLAFTPAESKWSAVAEISFDSNSDSSSETTRGNGVDGLPGTADDTFTTETETNASAEFETVTITYAYSDELSFTAGNILSYQGFETFDATGLYQYSAQGIGGGYVYSAGYAVGASADYVTDAYAFGAWIGDSDDAKQSYEFLAAFTGVEGLTVKAIYADDPGYETINVWASYEIDAFTFAVEYTGNDWEDDFTVGEERPEDVYMALVYYSFGDAGVTFRYSGGDYEDGIEFDRYTFSPSYSFSDNVFGLLEISYEEVDDEDATTLAAELIYSF